MFKKYIDQRGTTTVDSYELGDDFIKVKFKRDKNIYVYTNNKPGKEVVDNLKKAAQSGSGLTHYLDAVCRYMYEYIE